MTVPSVVELPSRPGKRGQSFTQFDAVSRQIIQGWENRRHAQGLSPYESANGFLKRESYRVIAHYIEAGSARFFESVIRRDGRSLSSVVKLAENPFHYGLQALFSDDTVLSRADRSTFASQMVYAYRHRVPANLLVGFLYQCGPMVELRRKLRDGVIEPGFELQFRETFPG